MLGFREWIVLEGLREGVYKDLLRDAIRRRAATETVAEVSAALSGLDFSLNEAHYEEENATKAEAIRRAAQRVRWAAMIERAEMIERIRSIMRSEYAPMVEERAEEVRGMIEAARKSFDKPESRAAENAAKTKVARDLDLTTKELEFVANPRPFAEKTRSESAVYSEDEDYEDDKYEPPKEISAAIKASDAFGDRLLRVSDSAKELLAKLGYIDDGELNSGSVHEKFVALDHAIRAAAAETGNDVPDNATTRLLKKDKKIRDRARTRFSEEIHKNFAERADRMGAAYGQETFIGPGGRSRKGELVSRDAYLDDYLVAALEALTTRPVSREQGVARAWAKPPMLTTPEESKLSLSSWADKIIGGAIRRIGYEAWKKEMKGRPGETNDFSDEPEQTSSRPSLRSIHAGRREDDGSRGSLDPKDYRSSTSVGEIASEERRKKILEAFTSAMEEIAREDRLQAMLICIRLGLGCDAQGNMPEKNAQMILMLMPDENIEDKDSDKIKRKATATPESFFASLGVASAVGGKDAANQEMIKQIQALDAWDTLKGTNRRKMSPRKPDGSLMLDRPNDPAGAKEWDSFMMTVVDAMMEAFKKLAEKMNRRLAASEYSITSGRMEPSESDSERWDLRRFLRAAFPDARIESVGKSTRLTFLDSGGKPKFYWDIFQGETKGSKSRTIKYLTLFQDSAPDDKEEIIIPQPVKCERCEGEDENCPDCMGWGYTLDIPKIIEMERQLINILPRQKNRQSRGGES